jgi:hypothetical protein
MCGSAIALGGEAGEQEHSHQVPVVEASGGDAERVSRVTAVAQGMALSACARSAEAGGGGPRTKVPGR